MRAGRLALPEIIPSDVPWQEPGSTLLLLSCRLWASEKEQSGLKAKGFRPQEQDPSTILQVGC